VCGCCLQLANLERRAVKDCQSGASLSAARAFYRAAVEQLTAASGGSLVSVDASLASVDDSVAATAAVLLERVSSLTRALDSWAQMEFKLGCVPRLFLQCCFSGGCMVLQVLLHPRAG
jgi:hypothetical protein